MLQKIYNWFVSFFDADEIDPVTEVKKDKGEAVITTVKAGKNAGKFRFILKAPNGYTLATSANYEEKNDCYNLIWTWFPNFEINDETV